MGMHLWKGKSGKNWTEERDVCGDKSADSGVEPKRAKEVTQEECIEL